MNRLLRLPTVQEVALFAFAVLFSLWTLGRDIPVIKISSISVAAIVLSYFAPFVMRGRPLFLSHPLPFLAYGILPFVLLNPFSRNPYALGFALKMAFAFTVFFLLVQFIDSIKTFEKVILLVVLCLTGVVLYLDYMSIVVFKSPFLSPHTSYDTFAQHGRVGKSTLAFLMALIFPYAYSRFCHSGKALYGFVSAVLLLSIVYTVSRMALMGALLVIVVSPLVTLGRRRFAKAAAGLVLLLVLLATAFRANPYKLYLAMKQGNNIFTMTEEAEFERMAAPDRGIVSFQGSRRALHIQETLSGFMKRPLLGHGTSAYRFHHNGSQTHNDYLTQLYDFGLLGFLLFVSLFLLSGRDLYRVRDRIPENLAWLWDGQILALGALSVMILFMSACETVPVWFILAGAQVFSRPYDLCERVR